MSARTDALRLADAAKQLAKAAGTSFSSSPRVAEAWSLLDLERVSSIPSLVTAFRAKRAAIEADKTLSDIGKREQLRGFANSHLGNIATRARRVRDLEEEHAAERANAVPLPAADAADMLLDIELARHVRALEPIPSRLVQMSERVRLAVARLPTELTGVTPEVQARVHGSLMSPALAARFAAEAEALATAREVTQAAIDEIAPETEWGPTELVQHFGDRWRLPGVAPTLADRLQSGEQS